MSASALSCPVLVDTGPLVAWLDRSDQDHRLCSRFFAQAGGPLLSTWTVLTAVLVIWRHRTNIQRLLAGTEPRIGQKKA